MWPQRGGLPEASDQALFLLRPLDEHQQENARKKPWQTEIRDSHLTLVGQRVEDASALWSMHQSFGALAYLSPVGMMAMGFDVA